MRVKVMKARYKYNIENQGNILKYHSNCYNIMKAATQSCSGKKAFSKFRQNTQETPAIELILQQSHILKPATLPKNVIPVKQGTYIVKFCVDKILPFHESQGSFTKINAPKDFCFVNFSKKPPKNERKCTPLVKINSREFFQNHFILHNTYINFVKDYVRAQ